MLATRVYSQSPVKSAARTPYTPRLCAKYLVRLGRNADDVRRAQRLRFEVFNLELNEGLAESHFTGLDVDPFDAVCDHLIVEEIATGEIV